MSPKRSLREQMQVLGIAGPAYLIIAVLMAVRTAATPLESAVALLDAIIDGLEPELGKSLQNAIDTLRDKNFSPTEIHQLEQVVSSGLNDYEDYFHNLLNNDYQTKELLTEVLRREDWLVQIFDHGIDEIIGDVKSITKVLSRVDETTTRTETKVDQMKQTVDLVAQIMLADQKVLTEKEILLDTKKGKHTVLFATFGKIGRGNDYFPGIDWSSLASGKLFDLLKNCKIRIIALSLEVSSEEEARNLLKKYDAGAIFWGSIANAYIRFECTTNLIGDLDLEMSSFMSQSSGQINYQAYLEHYGDVEAILYFISGVLKMIEEPIEATELFSEALKRIPEERKSQMGISNIHFSRGFSYFLMGMYADALADYDVAIALDPAIAGFVNNRGVLYEQLGRYDEAIEDYNNAIHLDPNLIIAFNNRGNVYAELGQNDLALKDYNRAIVLGPKTPEPFNNRASIYKRLGYYDLALEDYNEVFHLDPHFALGFNNRGKLFDEIGLNDEAMADFNSAIHYDPNFVLAYNNRGNLYERMGQNDNAMHDYNHALSLDPEFIIAINNRGCLYDKLGYTEKALKDLNLAIQLNPGFSAAFNSRAALYSRHKKHEMALSDYNIAIQLEPENVIFLYSRAVTYSNLNKKAKAIRDLTSIIELDPSFTNAYMMRGFMNLKSSIYPAALSDFETYVEMTGDQDPRIYNEIRKLKTILRIK